MKHLSQQEWEEQLSAAKEAIVLDVRTPEECNAGILENAICLNLLDRSRFMAELQILDPNKSYFVYCRSGLRSANACSILDNLGIKNTHNLVGGILNWTGKICIP